MSVARVWTTTLLCMSILATAAVPAAAEGGAGRFWRSLVIPGWGQHASKNPGPGMRFIITEAALWAGYAGLRGVYGIRRETYLTYAGTHAGAQTTGKSNVFLDDLGFYANQQQHNLFAVVDDGPRAEVYADTPEFSWEWDADSSRERYRELRNSAQTMERNALYVTGLIVVNHLVAAVHAARGSTDVQPLDAAPASVTLDWKWQPERLDFVLTRPF